MAFIDTLDPWMVLSGILAVLLVVEAKFAGSKYSTQRMHDQLMAERLKGYEMASTEQREADQLKWAKEWQESQRTVLEDLEGNVGLNE